MGKGPPRLGKNAERLPGNVHHDAKYRIVLEAKIIALVGLYPGQLTVQSLYLMMRDLMPAKYITKAVDDLLRARIITVSDTGDGYVLTDSYLAAKENLPRTPFRKWRTPVKRRVYKHALVKQEDPSY